jgi:hypothetical protein
LDAIGKDALFHPSLAQSKGKAEKNGFLSTALCDDSERIAKVLEEVISRREGNLPLLEGAWQGFGETEVPATDSATESWDA